MRCGSAGNSRCYPKVTTERWAGIRASARQVQDHRCVLACQSGMRMAQNVCSDHLMQDGPVSYGPIASVLPVAAKANIDRRAAFAAV